MAIYVTPSGWTAIAGLSIVVALSGVGVLAYAAAVTSPTHRDAGTATSSSAVASAPAVTPPILRETPPAPRAPVRDTRPPKPATPAPPSRNDAEQDPIKLLASMVPSNPHRTPAPTSTPLPPPEAPRERSPLADPAFRLTGGRYSDQDNIERAVTHEFGNAYRVADWNDLATYNDRLDRFFAITGMKTGEENSLWVTWNGNRDWNARRRFFISRFDGDKPRDYLAHKEKGNNTLCLGSFYNRSYQVLAIRK